MTSVILSTVRIQAEVLLWVLLADELSRQMIQGGARVLTLLLLPPLLLPESAGLLIVPVRKQCKKSSLDLLEEI